MQHTALLLVSFGTSRPDAFRREIEPTLDALRTAAGDLPVYTAFTSPTIRRIWAGRGRALASLPEAFGQMLADGVRRVYVQPTHLIPGREYEKLCAEAEAFRPRLESLTLGRPLLKEGADLARAASLLSARFAPAPGRALVFLGHGTDHPADLFYPALQTAFSALGRRDVLVGTVEGWPGFEELLAQIEAGGYASALLSPFLLVAGEHARQDMGGEEPGSLASLLRARGLSVECNFEGLGAFPEFRALYTEHLRALLEG